MRADLSPSAVTVVIVNWNGGDLLMRCLRSIGAHASEARVVVVDNDSSDGSREAASRAFPQYLVFNSGSNLGFGRANNLARRFVTTPFVLFLNPDTELRPDSLDRLLACARARPDAGAVGCRMVNPDGRDQELGLQWHTNAVTALIEFLVLTEGTRRRLRRWLPVVDPGRSGYVRKLYGGCLLISRAVMDDAGWFDERYFMYAEDADLSRTIEASGRRLYYCAEAAILHVGGGLTASAPNTFAVLMMQESINRMIGKYHGRVAAILHRAAVLVGGTVRLCCLLPLGLVAMTSAGRSVASWWQTSWLKQQQLILWALGLRAATVQGRVTVKDGAR